MKKALILMLAVGLAIGMLAVVGCGDKTTTIKTPEGEITYDQNNGDTEVTYGGETYKSSEKAPTEAELGVAIYPGATYVEGSGGSGSGSTQQGQAAWASGEFTTSDSFDTVVSWYKNKLGEPLLVETTGEKQATWIVNKGQESTTTVAVTVEGTKTLITISSLAGAGI